MGLVEKRQEIRKIISLTLALAVILGLLWFHERAASRSPEIVERFQIEAPKGAKSLRIWIPLAATNPHQKTELLEVKAPFAYRLTHETEFGNRFLFFEATEPKSSVEILVRSRISRWEQGVLAAGSAVSRSDLQPRGLVIVDERVRKIARETLKDISQPLEKARALYHYVLSHVDYDTSGTGWGRGDVAYVCNVKKGNCTDFHSLFIALCQTAKIPARFRMGVPLPSAREGGIEKYHCWAEFYIKDKGWIPVDISEAWKNPQKAEYYFGRLDANRILISTGREIDLSPKQNGPRLNFIFQPYVEVDGKPYQKFDMERRYQDRPAT